MEIINASTIYIYIYKRKHSIAIELYIIILTNRALVKWLDTLWNKNLIIYGSDR